MALVTDVLRCTKSGLVSLKCSEAKPGGFLEGVSGRLPSLIFFCGCIFLTFFIQEQFLGKEQFRGFKVFRVE